jgi:hypothetical protein
VWFPYGNCVTHPALVPISQMGIRTQRTAPLQVADQFSRGEQVHICIECSLVLYRLGAVLHVWLRSYRVCPAPLPYRGKLLVHRGASLCSLPAAVHRGRGPTPWHSLTFTGLCKMSLWLLSSPSQLCQLGLLSITSLCFSLISHTKSITTLISVWYMY